MWSDLESNNNPRKRFDHNKAMAKGAQIQVRIAELKDAAAISSVLYKSFLEYERRYTPEGFAATVLKPDQIQTRMNEGPVWVAVENGAVVGTLSAVAMSDELYLRGMAVNPEARSKGIGAKLLIGAFELAKQRGCQRVFLSTTPFLARAIRIYEHYGFRRTNEGPNDLFGTPLFTMVKNLHGAETASD